MNNTPKYLVALDPVKLCKLVETGVIGTDEVVDLSCNMKSEIRSPDDKPDYLVFYKAEFIEQYKDGLTWPTSTEKDTIAVIEARRFTSGSIKNYRQCFFRDDEGYLELLRRFLDDEDFDEIPMYVFDFRNLRLWLKKNRPDILKRMDRVCKNLGVTYRRVAKKSYGRHMSGQVADVV